MFRKAQNACMLGTLFDVPLGTEGRALMATVKVGEKAPEFSLPTEGRTVSLAEFRGKKNVVLLFYPLAWTPV